MQQQIPGTPITVNEHEEIYQIAKLLNFQYKGFTLYWINQQNVPLANHFYLISFPVTAT